MIFPDQSHINRVREALWQRPEGCASVMVGAGFSRNARKAGPSARNFPLWHDIVSMLCTKLYPPRDSDRWQRAVAEASGTSGFLRLAQEYEAAFGRVALHSLIREMVPDDDYAPDDMHKRLLRLPWRNVYTTNWDTLLERTRTLVADRAYSVVRTHDEIPLTPSPRIVKLHGSFPAHVPFIFTEEDYRTYPKKFAPFVNTVQQAMMETVFCLIGFSGDDPNFLHWSGWVRDNLGELAPKIYLAGWLDLSPHRRRMLEDRSVVPIDVSRHPKASIWPDHLRHRYATEWILLSLEHGQPYEATEWPSPHKLLRSPVPEIFQPVEEVTVDAPVEEPQSNIRGAELANLLEQVHAVYKAWKHNRKVYPGWLILPPNKHFLVGMSMHDWEQAILQVLPELSLVERIFMLRELVWRQENLLEPMSQNVENALQAVLDNIDCQARKIGGNTETSLQWTDIREAWRDMAMVLLTTARQRFDRGAFDRLLTDLLPFQDDHPDVAQRLNHEKCLWALNALDFAALETLLKDWRAEGRDPIWMARKAAILVEMDRIDEAIRLINNSLSIVREDLDRVRTFASPSREGWILWLALAFERGFSRSTEKMVDSPPAFIRWRQLAALQCDANMQKRDFLEKLKGDPEKKDAPLFDLGARRGKTIHFSNVEYERWIAAHRAVRLCEVAGLPPSANHMVIGSDLLDLAANQLVTADFTLALRLTLRIATSEGDRTFNHVWARSRVAAMPMADVVALVDLVSNVINYALPRTTSDSARSIFWVTRLRVAMEALSRLVLRVSPELAEQFFKQALSYYKIEVMAKHPWLRTPLDHLLSRSWEALPKSHRSSLILDILSAPISGLNGFEAFQHYMDPGDLIVNEDTPAPPRLLENEGRWSEVVLLITRGLGIAGEARKRAALRLVPITLWGRLTDPEKNTLAQALWHPDHSNPDNLPGGTSLNDWAFLLLPEPEPGLAEQRFRKKWLGSQEPKNEEGYNELFWQLGQALESLRRHQRPLKLTGEESANLLAIVEKWINLPLTPEDEQWIKVGTLGTREVVSGLQSILRELDLPSSIAEALFAKVAALNQTDTPGYRLFPGIAKSLPDKFDELAVSMRMGLASEKMDIAEEAVLGLHLWLRYSSEEASPIPPPPSDLVREIGVMIATRRQGVLNRALQVARWVFSAGSSEQRESIVQSTLHGLSYLIEELRYDRDHGDQGEEEIPLLRWGCTHLALAMSASGYGADATVRRWAEVAQDDPLPEVRHAEEPANVLRREKSPAASL
jgi:hypothetical protein